MTKTVFVSGSPVSADFLNSLQDISFDGQNLDGHYPKIINDDLSDTPGQIKPEWTSFRDTFKVSASAGLSATYTGGVVVLPTGGLATIAPGTIGLADNATNYIFLNESGVVTSATTAPVISLPLAQVTTVAGAISGAITDLRPRFRIQPIAAAIKVFGGIGEEGDYTLSGTDTLDKGYYYFRNFTINAGAVLTISKFAKISCSGKVIIAGAINTTFLATGGTSFASGAINVNLGGGSGGGVGPGSGSSAVGGTPYNYAAAPYGSGGSSGYLVLDSGAYAEVAAGGRGGGGLWIEASGDISVSGTISAAGEGGKFGNISIGTGQVSGGGGGSGGLVLLSSLSKVEVAATATIDVRGGSGGTGVGGNASGGGGGGGGQVVLISPNNNIAGATILLAGGAKGTNAGSGAGLGGGNGGGFGGTGGGDAGTSGLLILRNFRAVG